MTEEWRPIAEWDGYEVSNFGRVRSLTRKITTKTGQVQTKHGRVLKPMIEADGRRLVRLHGDGKTTHIRVYRLVLTAFVGPRPPGMEGCHNDGDNTNNRLDNLRWDTRAGNMQDQLRHGVHHQASKTHCPAGHPYEGDNLDAYVSAGRNQRRCRTCHRARARERMRRLYWERKGQAA